MEPLDKTQVPNMDTRIVRTSQTAPDGNSKNDNDVKTVLVEHNAEGFALLRRAKKRTPIVVQRDDDDYR